MSELESDSYDVVVLGTGLAESIAAAALAKAGRSVLHLDPNEYYAADQASLTLDELVAWAGAMSGNEAMGSSGPDSSSNSELADTTPAAGPSSYVRAQRRRYTHASTSKLTPELENDRRRYALSLFPSVLPSRGTLIATLIASGVSKYVGFRLLDSVGVWEGRGGADEEASGTSGGIGGDMAAQQEEAGAGATGQRDGVEVGLDDCGQVSRPPRQHAAGRVRRVPGSKEQVFKDKSIGLADKRRLMKFLLFVAGDFEEDPILKGDAGKETRPLPDSLSSSFSLPPALSTQITYAIAHCSTPDEGTLPALLRTRRYLRSIGRYGTGAFLVGQYGGAGEVAQGFCRACAVKGGTYVLGSQAEVQDLRLEDTQEGPRIRLSVPCHSTAITAKHLISNPDHLPSQLLHQTAESVRREITAHCVAILSSFPTALRQQLNASGTANADVAEGEDRADGDGEDTAVVLFPPEGGRGLIRALIMGEGTGSCPAGQFILYLSTSASPGSDPAALFQPYLARLAPTSLFECFYLSIRDVTVGDAIRLADSASPAVVLLRPYSGGETLTEGLDWEAAQGEAAFWAVMREGQERTGFFEREEVEEKEDDEDGEL